MMKNISRRVKIAGALILVIIVLIVYFVFSQRQEKNAVSHGPVTISNSAPTNDSTGASVFDPITITFNQPVDAATTNVTSDPAESWTIKQTGPSSIEVNHKLYLRVATGYVLTVLQHGNIVGTPTFETAHEQNDPRQLQTLQSDLERNYPLIVPYDTSDYHVFYTAPLTLEVDLKSSISTQDAISQVKSWVQSNGVNPSTHKYNVVTAAP